MLVVPGMLSTDAGATNVAWTIVAPPTATIVTPPALPGSVGSWTASTQSGPVIVIAIDATFLASYAQFRAVAGALPPTSSIANGNGMAITPPLPVDGTMRITAIGQGD
jgi:hypothetical protein